MKLKVISLLLVAILTVGCTATPDAPSDPVVQTSDFIVYDGDMNQVSCPIPSGSP